VKRIVADLMALHPQWHDLVAKYELVAAQARPEWGESTEQLALRGRIEEFDLGLVDFYGKLDGREIFWCWKTGEERIEFWHDLESGYTGRQPIPEVVQST
jgi:hypothetical protein